MKNEPLKMLIQRSMADKTIFGPDTELIDELSQFKGFVNKYNASFDDAIVYLWRWGRHSYMVTNQEI